jgi:hypothetical protein
LENYDGRLISRLQIKILILWAGGRSFKYHLNGNKQLARYPQKMGARLMQMQTIGCLIKEVPIFFGHRVKRADPAPQPRIIITSKGMQKP